MGFFQDLKEDLSQAVTELMDEEANDVTKTSEEENAAEVQPIEELVEEAEDTMKESDVETEDEIIEEKEEEPTEAEVEAMFKAELGINDAEDESLALADTNRETEEDAKDETIDEGSESMMDSLLHDIEVSKEKTKRVENIMLEEEYIEEAVDETAVITQGMVIKGNVKSKGSMDIIGSIEGDIDILGKLNVTGSINGNSKAAEVFADAAKIVGEIHTAGTVKIGASSIIIGNITATCAVIAGAVKGDIDVQGPVVLDTSAIVMGNIKSKSVQINNGAVIEGLCSQCYADINPTNFFDEFK